MSLSLSFRRLALALVATVAGVMSCAWAAPAGAHIYWANHDNLANTIGRASLDGSSANQRFITGATNPIGVAVAGEHVYWANGNGIGRANLDGSGANASFISGGSPVGVAVDAQHIYWANQSTGTIGRANLDGSGADQSFIAGASTPIGVAVDAYHVYWTNSGTDAIGQANLDGTGATQSFITGASSPVGVAVGGQYVYWTNTGTDAIGRANLSAPGVEQGFITGANSPRGVAVDGQHVYWTNLTTGTIGRASLDGTGAVQSFITGASSPIGVAVDGGVDSGSPPAASPSAVDMAFGTQPLGVFGAPRALTVTNSGGGNLQVDTARITGLDADDFSVSSDTCSHATLAIGATCTIHVRFGPSARGARQAILSLTSNDPASPLQITLNGTAGALPQGATGSAGPAGPATPVETTGPAASTAVPGAQGPAAPRGTPAQIRLVTCRTVTAKVRGHRVKRRRCTTRLIGANAMFTIPATARASLTRQHVLYATGTAHDARVVLHARRRVPAGRYTLTLRYRLHGHPTTTRAPITIG